MWGLATTLFNAIKKKGWLGLKEDTLQVKKAQNVLSGVTFSVLHYVTLLQIRMQTSYIDTYRA